MKVSEITIGRTYSKDTKLPFKTASRTVIEIVDGPASDVGKLVIYESDAIIGQKCILLSSFAAWARRVL